MLYKTANTVVIVFLFISPAFLALKIDNEAKVIIILNKTIK